VGETHKSAQEEKVKSTVVKPSNGRTPSGKQRPISKGKSWSIGLRRMTKRQKDAMYRVFVWAFLVIFTVSIVGGLIAITVLAPAAK
jgi:hypothetical protein